MHQIACFQENGLGKLHEFIRQNPLATIVTMGAAGMVANHFPVILKETGQGILQGHFARANAFWRDIDPTVEALAVFQSINHYITPTYYPSKIEHDKVVPTWNYGAVHVQGPLRIIQDKDWILAHLNELTDVHEKDKAVPWSVNDAPQKFIERQLNGIIGFEISVASISGAMKMSQNKIAQDALGVVDGLRAEEGQSAHDMADAVADHLKDETR